MITHHPSNDLLLEHAAGTLSWAFSLSVTAHTQLCMQCRQQVHHLNHIGGALLESVVAEPPAPSAFSRLMGKIDQVTEEEEKNATEALHVTVEGSSLAPSASQEDLQDLPRIVRRLLPNSQKLQWTKTHRALRVAPLQSGDTPEDVLLCRLERGGRLAEHGHGGREATLVLKGNFSDAEGLYLPGDFLLRERGQSHQPTATQDQSCLYLSVSEAPMEPVGVVGKLVGRLKAF